MTIAHTESIPDILNIISQGLIFVTGDGKIKFYNKEAENILNKASNLVLNQDFFDVFADDTFGFSLKKVMDEKKLPENCTHTNLNIKAEFIDHGLLIVFDKNYTQLEIAFDDMTSFISHDIKNPLGAILGFAKLLEKDLQDNPDLLKFVDYILQGANNINSFLDTLRGIYKPLNLHCQQVDIPKFLKEINTNIDVSASRQLIIDIDPGAIKLAINNLISYCNKFLEANDDFKIKVEKISENIYIEISFTGKDTLTSNFDDNFQNFYPKKGIMELAQIYRIISGHNGSLKSKCSDNNKISFIIKLPEKSGRKL